MVVGYWAALTPSPWARPCGSYLKKRPSILAAGEFI